MDNNSNGQKIGMEENCAKETIENKNKNAQLKKEAIEEISSSSSSMAKNQCASNEIGSPPRKKAKNSLKFGGWLPDCLDWFKRPELAQSALSTSSYTLNRYCWPKLHGKVKPYVVGDLRFKRKWIDYDNMPIILKKYDGRGWLSIPIADIKPPEYIIGFSDIEFKSAVDDRALQFVENILPLLNENVDVDFDYYNRGVANSRLMELLAPKINKLGIGGASSIFNDPYVYPSDIKDFDKEYPGIIYGIPSIWICVEYTETGLDLILKWLHEPREDGKTKTLSIHFAYRYHTNNLIASVKENFFRSTHPINFIICLHSGFDINGQEEIADEGFKFENKTTAEILEEYRKSRQTCFLVRHKNDEIASRANWEEHCWRQAKTTISLPWMESSKEE